MTAYGTFETSTDVSHMAAFGVWGNADISHQKLTETLAGLGIRHESDASTEGDGRRTWYDAAGV